MAPVEKEYFNPGFQEYATYGSGGIAQQEHALRTSNFDGFKLISLAQMPQIDVVILDSREKPGGVGEESVAPVAPAVVNALHAATGKRLRTLSLSRAGIELI